MYTRAVLIVFLVALVIGIAIGLKTYNHKASQASTNPTQQTPSMVAHDVSLGTSTPFYTINVRYAEDPRDTGHAMRTFAESQIAKYEDRWSVSSSTDNTQTFAAKEMPRESHSDDGATNSHREFDVSYVKYESSKLHTISYLYAMYELGDNASTTMTLASFTFDDKGQVNIDSLLNFDNGNDIALTKLLQSRLTVSLGQSLDAKLLARGLGLAYLKSDNTLDLKKCHCDGYFFGSNFQTFYVTDQGITFGFDQDTVAPHNDGVPEVLIRWPDLAPFLKPEVHVGA